MAQTKQNMVNAALDSEDAARTYYTRRSSYYDRITGYEVKHHRAAVGMSGIQEGDRVLEVACGTGKATVELVKLVGASGKLELCDLTAAMMEKAKAKIEDRGLLDRVAFQIADAKQLPYPDESFDVLYNSYMLDLIELSQFERILSEFSRVLKPGGRLVLVNMSKRKPGKTAFESIYERGMGGACRPVLLEPFVHQAGFETVQREYRSNRALGIIPLPFGTEIITATKPR